MKQKYDPELVVFKTKHYMINENIGKIILYYRDCSCLFNKQSSNSYLTKEIYCRKLILYENDKSWKSLNLESMEMQNLEKI